MPKKISQKDIEQIVEDFVNGKTIDDISNKFNCTRVTINRHLKKSIDKKQYEKIIACKKEFKDLNFEKHQELESIEVINNQLLEKRSNLDDSSSNPLFIEIAPLDYEIDNAPQKDLSSIPIAEVDFPKVVYMIVDKKIELEIKYLKEYPEWQFLAQEELNRKTIEIFNDIKVAKRFCKKDQKVIKVPNTKIFSIAAPYLLDKGISRIINVDILIAL